MRTEATGYGTVYFVQDMLETRGRLDGKRVVVGSGNVAITRSKGDSGRDRGRRVGLRRLRRRQSGIDYRHLKDVKEKRRERLTAYADERGSARHVTGGSIWDVPCDIALPCATQNELNATHAKTLLSNGVQLVAEGANMPCTPDAIELFTEAGILYAPGKASNAGGVATSALEMQQNASRDSWSFEQTDAELRGIMRGIHDTCVETAETYGSPGNYVVGANLAGYIKVADAMVAQGVI